MNKIKKIIIIGGGLSAWSVANSFSNKKNIKITLISKKNVVLGAQQLSPNGLRSFVSLIGHNNIDHLFETINSFKISLIDKKQINVLSNYDLDKNNNIYGSISRRSLINELKKSALKNPNLTLLRDEVKFFLKNGITKTQLLTTKGKLLEADIIFGADGYIGKSRLYVCGNEKKFQKRVLRSISLDPKKVSLTKSLLQVFLTAYGHFVIYPFKENKKQFVNYIFVPNKFFNDEQSSLFIRDFHPLFEELIWDKTYSYDSDENFSSIVKDNVFLFGDSALPIQPHLAQAGNQILEDAVYLKKLIENNPESNFIISNFIENRFNEKKLLKKHSALAGKFLGSNNVFSVPRNFIISKFSNHLFDDIFGLIWKSNNEK